jgi:hypothetical protein
MAGKGERFLDRLEERIDRRIVQLDAMARGLMPKDVPQASSEAQAAAGSPGGFLTEESFKAQMEKFLQSSFESMGDKLSGKLSGLLKDLKTVSGPVRESRMREIHQVAAEENIDLSGLFGFQKVDSNIEEIGVNEKKAKSIDKSLERLRKMREGKG